MNIICLYGKSLVAFDLPVPNGSHEPPDSMSSDTFAWDATIDLPWCSRDREFPRSALRWGMALTQDAYEDIRIPPAGFAICLDIKVGGLWVIIGHPQSGRTRRQDFARLDFLNSDWLNLNDGNGTSLRFEACFLSEGTRLCVFAVILSPVFLTSGHSAFCLPTHLTWLTLQGTPYVSERSSCQVQLCAYPVIASFITSFAGLPLSTTVSQPLGRFYASWCISTIWFFYAIHFH